MFEVDSVYNKNMNEIEKSQTLFKLMEHNMQKVEVQESVQEVSSFEPISSGEYTSSQNMIGI